jgi:hypothetical protein
MRDLHFVAGKFLDGELPADKDFLRHYYQTDLEQKFLSYYLLLGENYTTEGFLWFYNNFCDHTGWCCSTRWVRKLLSRYKIITKALAEAYEKTDLDTIACIKSGNFTQHLPKK